MFGRLILYGALALALGIVIVSACGPQPDVASSPTPTPTASASRSASPATTPPSSPTTTATVRPSTSATPSATAISSPGSSPAAACPRTTGGNASNQAQLVAVRVAHQPGFDRLVFEFGQSTAPGPFGMPAYTVETATSLSGPSGQPVTITGNALFGVRFQNASTQNPNGTPSYTGSNDIKPTTPLIKEIKIVEDFERVLLWGVGLDHLACPKVSELAGPFRVVLDFPSPP
jgi:cytoskeletal protein RodZ